MYILVLLLNWGTNKFQKCVWNLSENLYVIEYYIFSQHVIHQTWNWWAPSRRRAGRASPRAKSWRSSGTTNGTCEKQQNRLSTRNSWMCRWEILTWRQQKSWRRWRPWWRPTSRRSEWKSVSLWEYTNCKSPTNQGTIWWRFHEFMIVICCRSIRTVLHLLYL